MTAGRVQGALLAQAFGQALTSWSIVAHLAGWPEVSPLVAVSLLAAVVVPLRHDGTLKDRALGNFAACLMVAGFMWWEVLQGGLDSILGGRGFGLGIEGMLMLSATVLFSLSGALFWTLREAETS
jgi:hypothetical protein